MIPVNLSFHNDVSLENHILTLLEKMERTNICWVKFSAEGITFDKKYIRTENMAEFTEALSKVAAVLHIRRIPNYCIVFVPQENSWIAGTDILVFNRKKEGN